MCSEEERSNFETPGIFSKGYKGRNNEQIHKYKIDFYYLKKSFLSFFLFLIMVFSKKKNYNVQTKLFVYIKTNAIYFLKQKNQNWLIFFFIYI